MDQRAIKISETLLRVINKIFRNEKAPKHYGIDVLLHPSEIHMVMFIGNNKGTHLSELARIVGVTRGAVSQVVAKLEKKGLVEKAEDPENNLKTVPVLTNKGQVAYWNHERMHEEVDAELFTFIEKLSEKEIGVIENFLRHLEKMADNHK